jgi:large subunit ribosomal protein L9
MQIILMEKVVNLGQLGDVVKVKNGYARNFLIPQGKAKRATPIAIAEFAVRRAELEKTQAEILAAAQAHAAKLEGLMVQVTRKAGVDGKLFGSVTNADIEEALAAQGFEIERAMIRMPQGSLKQIGEHPVTVALHGDVIAHLVVSVLGDPTS